MKLLITSILLMVSIAGCNNNDRYLDSDLPSLDADWTLPVPDAEVEADVGTDADVDADADSDHDIAVCEEWLHIDECSMGSCIRELLEDEITPTIALGEIRRVLIYFDEVEEEIPPENCELESLTLSCTVPVGVDSVVVCFGR